MTEEMVPALPQDGAPSPGVAAGPLEEVILTLSYRCNLRCKTCYLFLKDGQHVAPQIREDLSAADWMRVVDQVAPQRPRVFFVGGEPLIFKGILELVAHASRRGLYTYLCTNGSMLKHVARELVDTGIDRVDISLDGLEETHDWIRGAGVFHRTLAGIEALLEARRAAGRPELQIGLAVLMCHHNLDHLLPLRELARDLGLDFLKYQFMMFNTRANIEADRAQLQRLFGIDSPVMEGYVDILDEPLDGEKLAEVVNQLRAAPGPPAISFFPEVPDPRGYYADLDRRFDRHACTFAERVLRILPNGDVPVCFGHADFRAGNVLEQGPLQIYAGPVLEHWRAELRAHGLFPGCLRCSQRDY